jgi:hypothetical protein
VVQLLLGKNQVHQWRVVCKVVKAKQENSKDTALEKHRTGCGGKDYIYLGYERMSKEGVEF